MGNLDILKAKEALEKGKRITHSLFMGHEHIGLKVLNDMRFIEDEAGYLLPEHKFWEYRKGDHFQQGWSITE